MNNYHIKNITDKFLNFASNDPKIFTYIVSVFTSLALVFVCSSETLTLLPIWFLSTGYIFSFLNKSIQQINLDKRMLLSVIGSFILTLIIGFLFGIHGIQEIGQSLLIIFLSILVSITEILFTYRDNFKNVEIR